LDQLVERLDCNGLVGWKNPAALKRLKDAFYAKMEGKDVAKLQHLDDMAYEVQRLTMVNPGWTKELAKYLQDWLEDKRWNAVREALALPLSKLKDSIGAAGDNCQEKVPCTKLCNPGAKSNCPNYLYGKMTAAMDEGRIFVACYEVERMLKQMGVDPEKCSRCILGAIMCGMIVITDKMLHTKNLDQLIRTEKGFCGCKISITLGNALYQGDDGEGLYGRTDSPDQAKVHCRQCKRWVAKSTWGSNHYYFLTGMCHAMVTLDDGRRHFHCAECPGYGTCYHEPRMRHCSSCGKHSIGKSCLHDKIGCIKNKAFIKRTVDLHTFEYV